MHSPFPLRLSLMLSVLALAAVALITPAVRYESGVAAQPTRQVVTVDATATFLRAANSFDRPALPIIIPLAASGLAPGDELKLSYEVENFKYFGFCDPAAPSYAAPSVVLLGLFSSSNQIDAANVLRRVPGAIDAGADHVGPSEDDIPEDFRVTTAGLTIKVPAGATHLFLGIADSFYLDNCGKVNVTIERAESQPTCSLAAELDATATFLHAAVTVDRPTSPTIVPLAAQGFAPGDEVKLSYTVNDFKYGSFCDPSAPNVAAQGVFLLGLFSSSNQIEPANAPARVPGAIDAGVDYPSSSADDIPQDFRIAPDGLTIKIPAGATHLFLGIADSFYADNCGKVSVRIARVVPQLAVPATTHGFSGDIFPLPQPFGMALSSGNATEYNLFNLSSATIGDDVTGIGGLAGLQPQGLAVSTPGGQLTGISCLDSVWDFSFVIAAAGNTVGDTVTFFLQNPDGSGVLTLGVFTIEAGGARVTSLHPDARFYVDNRLADIPATGVGTFLPFSNSAGSAGARTVPLLMSMPMDPGSIFMDCRQMGFSVARGSGGGTLSLVITDVVLVRKEMAGDRDRPGVGLIFGLGGGFPTGAACAVSCPACL